MSDILLFIIIDTWGLSDKFLYYYMWLSWGNAAFHESRTASEFQTMEVLLAFSILFSLSFFFLSLALSLSLSMSLCFSMRVFRSNSLYFVPVHIQFFKKIAFCFLFQASWHEQ